MTEEAAGEDSVVYFDIRGKTAPLVTIDEPAWTGTTAEMRKRARPILYAMRGSPLENLDTGWSVTIGRNAIEKTLNEGGRTEHFQALEKLPELLRNAVLVRKTRDTKERMNIYFMRPVIVKILLSGILESSAFSILQHGF